MNLRDRLNQLLDRGELVELYFAPASTYFLARLTQVGQDFLEFDACDEEENIIAHNILPLGLLMTVTTMSTERSREKLEMLLRRDAEGGTDEGRAVPGP
ncbi:MAG: hypothetical protein VKP72_09620 [bacterium]|nr:hypothetical protein [bacterium]